MGIDASSSCTGVAIFEEEQLIYYNKFRPDKNVNFRSNTCQIVEKIADVIKNYKIDVIYMEDVPEFAKKGAMGRNILGTITVLGAVQGIFYHKLGYELGYNIEYIPVSEWRKTLGFLKGADRDRESQKQKAIEYVNKNFGLNLYFAKGKRNKLQDDDIAEAICIVCAKLKEVNK